MATIAATTDHRTLRAQKDNVGTERKKSSVFYVEATYIRSVHFELKVYLLPAQGETVGTEEDSNALCVIVSYIKNVPFELHGYQYYYR